VKATQSHCLPTCQWERKATDDSDRAFIILESFLKEGSPGLEAIDDMTAKQFKEFLDGWSQGGSLGE
jgi:hypothetical protein